jgi:hypothetical protein
MFDLYDDGCMSKLHVPEAGMPVVLAEQPLLELPGTGQPSKLLSQHEACFPRPFPPNQAGQNAFQRQFSTAFGRVADPDPYVFGPPGSGSNSQRYGSGSGVGSGSFYRQAKNGKKNLDFYCFVTSL